MQEKEEDQLVPEDVYEDDTESEQSLTSDTSSTSVRKLFQSLPTQRQQRLCHTA